MNELEKKDLDSVTEQDLVNLIAQQDIGSFAESLLKQIQADGGEDAMDMNDIKPEVAGETPPHSSGDQDRQEPEIGPKISTLDIPTKLESVKSNVPVKLSVNINMKGSEIVDACANFAKRDITISKVLDAAHALPNVPEKPTAKLKKEELLPPTPSVYLDNKKDAFSPQLQVWARNDLKVQTRKLAK